MSEARASPSGERGTAPGEEAARQREARAAVLSAAGLYVVGAALTATAALLPHVSSAAGVVAVALTALLTAGALMIAFVRGKGGLGLAWVADLWGVVLVGVLCAVTGDASSPFALIYFFAIGHAAAFQPRNRFALVSVAGLLAFLAPLLYTQVSTQFAATASIGAVLALLTSAVVHLALNRVREQQGRLELLIAATAEFDSSLDPAETLRKIAHTAVPELAELCVIDLVDQRGSIGNSVAAAVDPSVSAGVERMRKAFPFDIRGTHPVAQVLRTGLPRVISALTDRGALEQAAQSDEHRRFMREAGYRSAAVFPMVARGRTHGAISFLRLRNDARFGPSQLAVLQDLTGRAAMAFDNARLYAERAQVARSLRRSLMPAVLPVVPGLELASYFRPTGAGNEVGGDFYDAFGDEDGLWLVVGDVCGKGAEAAALTGFLRHTTIAYAREGASPARVLSQVNRAMLEQDFDGQFATAILAHLGVLKPEVEVTIAAAGHPAALLARVGGQVEEFGDCGTLLGVFPDPVIEQVSTILEPGDSLALYTDGLSEAHAPDRTVTAQEMIEQLEKHSPRFAQDAIDALLELVNLDDDVRDDIAILAVQVKPTSRRVDGRAALTSTTVSDQ
jgi:hypothetical protein